MDDATFEDLTQLQRDDVKRATAVVNALHFEATRIAQRRVGPLDTSELGSIVVALATIYATLPKGTSMVADQKGTKLDLSNLMDE